MDSRVIIASVVRRWKQASESDWYSNSDPLDMEEAKAQLKSDEKEVKDYISRCQDLARIYRSLVEPLMTPRIGVYADRLDQRVKDTEALIPTATKD